MRFAIGGQRLLGTMGTEAGGFGVLGDFCVVAFITTPYIFFYIKMYRGVEVIYGEEEVSTVTVCVGEPVASLILFFFHDGMGNLVQASRPCHQITKPVPVQTSP